MLLFKVKHHIITTLLTNYLQQTVMVGENVLEHADGEPKSELRQSQLQILKTANLKIALKVLKNMISDFEKF